MLGEGGSAYGQGNQYSAEVEQELEQSNKCETAECANTALQTQVVLNSVLGSGQGSSYSTEVEQVATQENKKCEESGCF